MTHSAVDVLLLWHMHQPRYVHPSTGRPVLPWVRLHAASGYLDMARALERRPGARVTVNLVPVLVEQLEAMVGGLRDDLEIIVEKPADDLDEAERRSVLGRSFSVRWDRCIEPRPRYAELHARRTDPPGRFSPQDLRDLQCLFLLSWLGFAAREDEPAIEALERKGRHFAEEEKALLSRTVRVAAGKVLPAWRRLAAQGQAELITSPYFHPIIPLVIDSETARRSRPGDPLPPRFHWREDAREQIERARLFHERCFGTPPRGMWPPEGSVSPETALLYGECGVSWLAADEEVLFRSGTGHGPPARAKVWRFADVQLVFRNRELSDRIGFRYADVPADAAAEDLVASARAASGPGGLVGLFLDGENAWESYPKRGADFLDALYRRLESGHGGVRSRTISEALAERGPGTVLDSLHSGSWIDGSFRTWIGDLEKNRAWSLLGQVRDRLGALERSTFLDSEKINEARSLLLAAEGSDWFWWFGEPFSSAEDPVFDELFRAHLTAACRALGEAPPAALVEAIGQGGVAPRVAAPLALISPRIDGKADRFYDWHGAARYELGRGTAMADGAHPVEKIWAGFDLNHLYLRLDPARGERRRVGTAKMLLRVRVPEGDTRLQIWLGAADGGPELRALEGRIGAIDVVELAIPFSSLNAHPRDDVRLWLTLEFAGIVFARVPRDGVLAVTAPWPGWEDENWSA